MYPEQQCTAVRPSHVREQYQIMGKSLEELEGLVTMLETRLDIVLDQGVLVDQPPAANRAEPPLVKFAEELRTTNNRISQLSRVVERLLSRIEL